jgi:hypothetical protein
MACLFLFRLIFLNSPLQEEEVATIDFLEALFDSL